MKLVSTPRPMILLACDLGKSGSKFFYKLQESNHPSYRSKTSSHALWMDSEVAHQPISCLKQMGTGGRSQDNAWYCMGDSVTLVGKAAKMHLEYNSFKEDKSLKAPERIAAALGAIAHSHNLPAHIDAVIWIVLPIHELNTRQRIAQRLQDISQGFRFHDAVDYRFSLTLSFRPEGYGIYVNRKQQLEQQGIPISHRTTWIEMLGHRNGTQLAFETGSLSVAKSTSKFPGFWEVFEKAAVASGVSSPDYGILLRALATQEIQQYSVAKGDRIDLTEAVHQVESGYLSALDPHFNDNLVPSLAAGQGEVIFAGGAAALMQSTLTEHFQSRGFGDRLHFACEHQEHFQAWVTQELPEVHEVPSIPVRMLDCFGVFQSLLGETNRTQGAA